MSDADHVHLRHYEGDINNNDDLEKAFDGATMVIHNASVIDTTCNPDAKTLHRINVLGMVLLHCLERLR